MTSETMAEAILEAMKDAGGKASRKQIEAYLEKHYPDRWRPGTLTSHLYSCVVNNRKAYIHHPHTHRFLYKATDGTLELYDPKVHGENEWEPMDDGDDETADEVVEASISLERDIEDHLVAHLGELEPGLELVERQARNEVGRIDILARDAKSVLVVIELKVGEAKDASVGQIARYMGLLNKKGKGPVRGILIAADFPEGVKYAASMIPSLALKRYRVSLSFESEGL